MTYFSNLEKKINDNQKKPKIANTKVLAIILTVVATIGYFSLFTNLIGFLKHFLLGFFGIFAYAIFTSLYVISGLLLKGKKYTISKKYLFAIIFALFSILSIFHMAFSGGVNFSTYGTYLSDIYNMQVSVGGLLLGLITYPLQKFLNFGAYIVFAIVLVVCVTVIYNGIAEAKALSKIDFKFFKKRDKFKTVEPVNTPNTHTIKIETEQNIDEFKSGQNNQSVGLGAEIEREKTAREIAREKLGLDKIDERNTHIDSNANQLDTFKQNYMNTGGSVFATKNYERPDISNSNLSGTFGYSTVLETQNKKVSNKIEDEKHNEYRKFMGLEPVTKEYSSNDYQSEEKVSNAFTDNPIYETFSSSNDFYEKHESTESSDEKLFGAPKAETNIKFDYASPAEKVEEQDFMDKLVSDDNKEIKPENIEEEVKQENDLFNIFSSPVPKEDIVLPKGLQNDPYGYTKKFDIKSINPIDDEITKMQDYKNSAPTEIKQDLPKQKIPKYHYTKPTLDLLSTASTDPSMYGGNVEETSHKIESVLEEFKIPAKVVGITRGPAVTRYELEMPVGISVNKIPALESDIAMRIATSKKIMIQAPIPGMSAFGIEVPNDKVATVSLKEVLASEAFILSKSPCSFALGKELNGVTDICAVNKMPHVLIAGSTGSGKSVCLNSLILSILFKSSPEDVKFILIDPKRVEFSIYAGLPKKADNALGWAVREMEKRYDALAEHRVRNIEEYNNLQDVKDRYLPKMPYIIIIMDEFADIMQSPDCKDIESKVIRLAAKARAAGIHLVLATQRPSVDVLSGTAKNNFPARIAFFLTTQTDSRTILGYGGAENLLGRGDMLYVAPGSNEGAKRLQGCYVSDEEVKAVVEFVTTHNDPDFDPSIESAINKQQSGDSVNPDGTFASFDDFVDEEQEMNGYAKNVMKEFIRVGRASATYIQRTQRVGFAKAGRIMDYLEKKKYIAPSDGTSKARAVYMTKQQYIQIFGDVDFDDHD